MSSDWYRNRTWNESIERWFEEKLKKSRLKEQYLRIQASTLAKTHPEEALRLLDRYFEFPKDHEHAQAHCDRATALIALGRIDAAADAYDAAIRREEEYSKLKTQAWLELPFFVAVRKIAERYERAVQLLETHSDQLLFPVDRFKWHAAQALIAAEQGKTEDSSKHADMALQAARSDYSGFDSHPSAGLVGDKFDDVSESLKQLLGD